VIEQILYFLLGVLLATLAALLVLPAVWHRAVRLTTRRVEAAVPVSLFEIQADKDQQRAFFALSQRRLELQVDELRAAIVAHAATIEAQRQRNFELEQTVAELSRTGDGAAAIAAERAVLIGELQDQVSDLTARGAALDHDLAAARETIAAQEATVAQLDARVAELTATLAEREASLSREQGHVTDLEAEAALLTTNLTATTHRLETTTAALEAERAGTQRLAADLERTRADLAGAQALVAARAEDIARLSAELERTTGALAAAHTDLDATRSVVHAFEHRRASEFADAEAETRRIAADLDRLRADHSLMADALERARSAAAPIEGPAPPADLAPVKEALADLAAQIVVLTSRMEGAASPVPALVASDAGAPSGLAERIRALLAADGTAHAAPEADAPQAVAAAPARKRKGA
jgi:chromosome segregation ATPase